MNRSKIVAIVAGVISITLAIVYLLIVQLLDLRREMIPAPITQLPQQQQVAQISPSSAFGNSIHIKDIA